MGVQAMLNPTWSERRMQFCITPRVVLYNIRYRGATRLRWTWGVFLLHSCFL